MTTAIKRIPVEEIPTLDAEALEAMTPEEVRDELAYTASLLRTARALGDLEAIARLEQAERDLTDELRSRALTDISAAPSPTSFAALGFALLALPQV